jgi:hypothetical protein
MEFWVLTVCSSAQCFGGTYRFHLHGWTINQSKHRNRWKAECSSESKPSRCISWADLIRQFIFDLCLVYCSPLNMEATCLKLRNVPIQHRVIANKTLLLCGENCRGESSPFARYTQSQVSLHIVRISPRFPHVVITRRLQPWRAGKHYWN